MRDVFKSLTYFSCSHDQPLQILCGTRWRSGCGGRSKNSLRVEWRLGREVGNGQATTAIQWTGRTTSGRSGRPPALTAGDSLVWSPGGGRVHTLVVAGVGSWALGQLKSGCFREPILACYQTREGRKERRGKIGVYKITFFPHVCISTGRKEFEALAASPIS